MIYMWCFGRLSSLFEVLAAPPYCSCYLGGHLSDVPSCEMKQGYPYCC